MITIFDYIIIIECGCQRMPMKMEKEEVVIVCQLFWGQKWK